MNDCLQVRGVTKTADGERPTAIADFAPGNRVKLAVQLGVSALHVYFRLFFGFVINDILLLYPNNFSESTFDSFNAVFVIGILFSGRRSNQALVQDSKREGT